jgi:DNA invertase Pin-like site-specific DNA recombinase
MLDLISANLVGAIFVVDISRLARNTLDLLNFITACIRHDVLLIVGGRIMDPQDSQDLFFSQITGAVAEYENRLRVTRMQEARRNKAKRGEIVSLLPVGWVRGPDGAYDYDPETKEVNNLIIQTFWQERSVRKTVRALNQKGIKLPSRAPNANKLVWRKASFDAVWMFLHHPAYAGTYVYGRTLRVPGVFTAGGHKVSRKVPENAWIKTPNALPPYLSEEDQQSIKAFLKRNSRPRTRISHSPALFQGLLRCGNCGVLLRVRYQNN